VDVAAPALDLVLWVERELLDLGEQPSHRGQLWVRRTCPASLDNGVRKCLA
jgi:hypothetical protein